MTETLKPARSGQLRAALAPITNVVVRDATGTGDGSWVISGYAAVFDQATILYDGNYFRMREQIAPGAFDEVLASDPLVHLNFGHDMQTAIASTQAPDAIGRLKLAVDSTGLHFDAKVDPTDPDCVRLAAKMRRGVVNQASFAFRIGDEDVLITSLPDGRDDELYTIRRVSELFDVCACAQGAYPQTTSQIRSVLAPYLPDRPVVADSDAGGHAHRSDSEGGSSIAPLDAAGVAEPRRDIAALRALHQRAHLTLTLKEL